MKRFCLVCLILLLCVLMTPALAENAESVVTNSVTFQKGVSEAVSIPLREAGVDAGKLSILFYDDGVCLFIPFPDTLMFDVENTGKSVVYLRAYNGNFDVIYFGESSFEPAREMTYHIVPLGNRVCALTCCIDSAVADAQSYRMNFSVALGYQENGTFIYGDAALAQAAEAPDGVGGGGE